MRPKRDPLRDSDTYQAILEEGEVIQAKKAVLILGTERFGAPDEAVRATVAALDELDRLDRIFHRILDASGWQDLLDTP